MKLWTVIGLHWRLPVFVTPLPDTNILCVDVETGARYPNQWAALLIDMLRKHGVQSDEKKFFIEPETLAKIAVQSESNNPEDVISYNQSLSRRLELREHGVGEPLHADFINSMHRKGFGLSPGHLAYQWHCFCKHMLEWMVNTRKPVPLLFARIYPLPFRPNWCSMIKVKHRKFWRVPDDAEFADPKLLFYSKKSDVPLWSLNIRPNKTWWSAIIKSEQANRKFLGSRYWDKMLRVLNALIPTAKTFYDSFRSQAYKPSVVVSPRQRVGGRFARRGEAPARGTLVPSPVTHDLPDEDGSWPRSKAPGHGIEVDPQDERLSLLRHFQPDHPDLRDTGPNIQ